MSNAKQKDKGPWQVKALGLKGAGKVAGFYNQRRVMQGEIFNLADKDHFSERWMSWDLKATAQTTEERQVFGKAEATGEKEVI